VIDIPEDVFTDILGSSDVFADIFGEGTVNRSDVLYEEEKEEFGILENLFPNIFNPGFFTGVIHGPNPRTKLEAPTPTQTVIPSNDEGLNPAPPRTRLERPDPVVQIVPSDDVGLNPIDPGTGTGTGTGNGDGTGDGGGDGNGGQPDPDPDPDIDPDINIPNLPFLPNPTTGVFRDFDIPVNPPQLALDRFRFKKVALPEFMQ
jgi:hypothetical protein